MIEPEVALLDLFPAITGEPADTSELSFDENGQLIFVILYLVQDIVLISSIEQSCYNTMWLKIVSNLFSAKTQKAEPPSSEEINFLLRDPMRLTLYTYCTAMLHHVLTLDFFQEVKERNGELLIDL